MSGNEPTMHNILEDLLGVKADQAVQTPATQEVDELIKLTHRGRHRPAKESSAPGPTTDAALPRARGDAPSALPVLPANGKPAKPVATVPPAARPEKPSPMPPEPAPAQKNASLLALCAILRLSTKNFQFEMKLPDQQQCLCAFKNGRLANDHFIDQDDQQAGELRSILLVDSDSTFVIEMAGELAEHESRFLTLTAATGRQALRILETKKIDLLITGLKMPEMDGFELMNYMKTHFPAVPILAVSTFDFPAMHSRVKQLGARRHFIKPVQPLDLSKVIIDLLSRQPGKKSVKGMVFVDFITLLGLSNTTCFVDIFQQGKDHFICRVEKGLVLSVSCGPLKGEAAIRELVNWNDFLITFRQSPF